MQLLKHRLFLAVCSGHFAIDVLNSLAAVLLAVLATPFQLSNAQIGLALTIYALVGSLSQPLFGWLTDRMARPTLMAAAGLLWTTLCFVVVAFAATWPVLLTALSLAALGSGCFHPIGTAQASLVGRQAAGRSSSIFFFGGQVGLSVGPIIGGILFARWLNLGILPICLLAIPAIVLLATAQPIDHQAAQHHASGNKLKVAAWLIVAFIVLVAIRSSIQASYSAFLPKLFADRGWAAETYGTLAGVFMFASAIGNIITGEMADRYGMRVATVWPLIGGVPGGLLCLWAPSVGAAFVGCALAGLLIGGQHSVLVVHAQRLLPVKQGLASGLILGFTFAAGGIGTWLAGHAGDIFGLLPTMQVVTLLGLPVAVLALTLPGKLFPWRTLPPAVPPISDAPVTEHGD